LSFSSVFFSSVDSSAISSTTSSIILAGADAEATISLGLDKISNILVSIINSDTLITSHISFNFDKSTSNESTKSFGKHFTSISFNDSSIIAHSLAA
jgi:hypothetical protein